MRICCDIDGVLADVREHIERYLLKDNDWDSYFAHTLKFPPILPVAELLHRWNQHLETYLVTGRPESNRRLTELWLARQLPELLIPSDHLIMRPNGDRGPTAKYKMEVFRELEPDLIIDDSPEVVKAASKAGFIAIQIHGFRATKNDNIPFGRVK